MIWIETSIVIPRVATEEVATLFEHYGQNGFIEEFVNRDPSLVKITFFLQEEEDLLSKTYLHEWLNYVSNTLAKAKIPLKEPIVLSKMTEKDWLEGWKEYAKPVELVPEMLLVPQWQQERPEGAYFYDSTLAFGTGDHPTTYSCAQLMYFHGKNKKIKKLLDVGTGTGVLLMVGHHVMPKAELVGIDIDGPSVKQARENMTLNGIEATIIEGNLATDYEEEADLIVANLTVDPLLLLLEDIKKKLANHGILIISGIVDERLEEIEPLLIKEWTIIEHIHAINWHTFALQKAL